MKKRKAKTPWVPPTEEELAPITARIRHIMSPAFEVEYREYHAAEARKYRAKAAAARQRIADLLRKAREATDDERWLAFLGKVGFSAEEADVRMRGRECDVADPIEELGTERATEMKLARVDPPPSKVSPRVYFIQGVGGGPIKIGVSEDPTRRLSDLQVGSPVRLMLVGTAVGGPRREAELHRRLAAHRLHGEWFADAPEVRAEIAEVLQ